MDLLTTAQVAVRLELSPRGVRKHAERGNLKFIMIGDRLLFTEDMVTEFEKTRRGIFGKARDVL